MDKHSFAALLTRKGYTYKTVKGRLIVTHNGSVDLGNLTTLREGIKFENQGYVYLDSLTGKHAYRGAEYVFRHIDGYTMVMLSSKSYAGHVIHSAKYFAGGAVDKMRECYVAEADGLFAHGDTIKSAIEDLQYKMADQEDKQAVAHEVRDTGLVTLPQFRAITGACREGIRQHLSQNGIDLDSIESMPLEDAIKAMSGTTYGDTFIALVEGR